MSRKAKSTSGADRTLTGRWLHSHEEDAGEDRVYRRDGFPFPPSRGRAGFALRADGSMDQLLPGPTDRPSSAPGAWRVESNSLELAAKDAQPRRWRIIALEPDRLVLRVALDESSG